MPIEYKIERHGYYSSGGMWPRWGKKGKVWRNLCHVKNHLKIAPHGVYMDAKLVAFETTVTPVTAPNLTDLFEEIYEDAEKKKARQERLRQDALEERERAQLEVLKRKYPE